MPRSPRPRKASSSTPRTCWPSCGRCGEGPLQPQGKAPGQVKTWWKDNRPAAPDLFDEELAKAVELLAVTPRMGAIYRTKDGVVTYRLLLPRTEQHVYYYIEEQADEVVVVTVWGVRCGRGPKL